MHNVSSHFPSMVNNIGPSLVAMEHWRNTNLLTFDFEWQALQWTSFVEQMMTSTTWQISHNFWNASVVGLAMDNTSVTWKIN